jgi:hypothetical protein
MRRWEGEKRADLLNFCFSAVLQQRTLNLKPWNKKIFGFTNIIIMIIYRQNYDRRRYAIN